MCFFVTLVDRQNFFLFSSDMFKITSKYLHVSSWLVQQTDRYLCLKVSDVFCLDIRDND